MHTPALIQALESEIGHAFTEVPIQLIMRRQGARSLLYSVGGQGEVTGVHIEDFGLRQLPKALVAAPSAALTQLNLFGNSIADVAALGGFPRLEKVNLDNNQLTTLDVFARLPQLQTLYLYNNRIADAGPLRHCVALQRLDLAANALTDIAALAGLEHLRSLYLNGNQIGRIEPLAGLVRLRELSLWGNQIREIGTLRSLAELRKLDLHANQIVDIAPLEPLKALDRLYLSHNQIADIAPLRGLHALVRLDLAHNPIRHLPEWITEFEHMGIQWGGRQTDNFINLAENPIENIPPEFLEQGRDAVRVWFAEHDKQAVNELKVLFVGEGAAGKTSLMKQLTGQAFDAHEPITKGLNISDLCLSAHERPLTMHLWDFGGQEYMHSTHQFFLSRRSLYVLVLDGRKEEKYNYWIKLIKSFGGNSPIVVVLNKIDKNSKFFLNEKFMREKYPTIRAFFRVSCATGEGIAELLNGLVHAAQQMEMVQTQWIRRWFAIRNRLTLATQDFISYQHFLDICHQEHEDNEQNQRILLEYLDNLGVLLHFSEFDLQDTHILNPQWVTEAVYRIINYEKVMDNGHLPLAMVPEILRPRTENDFQYPVEKQGFIVRLMEKFELCFRIKPDTILIPDVLMDFEPDYEIDKFSCLKIKLKYTEFLPKSILPRLMVKMGDYLTHSWRTGAIFVDRQNNARAILKTDEETHQLLLYIDGEFRRDFYTVLRSHLYEINQMYESGWEELIPCNCKTCAHSDEPTYYDYEELRYRLRNGKKTVECRKKPFEEMDIRRMIDDLMAHQPRNEHAQLLEHLVWCAQEIQQKHHSLHNDENRYNDLFHTLLRAHGYTAEQEARTGTSATGTDVGRLDLRIALHGRVLALFEAFRLNAFGAGGQLYTANHLLKLLGNYNPNGIKHCVAVAYVHAANFEALWHTYQSAVAGFVYQYPLVRGQLTDLTHELAPNATALRIGLGEHSRDGQIVRLYHILMHLPQ